MDAMLQRHCARYIYVIPDGLRELMSDISREVLRSHPEDMYTFIADYLDALMITRENARVAARLVESLTEMAITTTIFLEETGMPREDIDNIVDAIKKTFKKSLDESERHKEQFTDVEANIVADVIQEAHVDSEQAEIAALIIQHAYRRFKERQDREKELLSGIIDWRVAARSAIILYRRTGVTNEEAHRAATLIKAAYKGYYTRQMMKKLINLEQIESLQHIGTTEPTEQETYESMEETESDEKHKTVTIDYDTVIPHVDFDTTQEEAVKSPDQPEAARKLSTASSIARHSLRFILDAAVERIGKQSVILEEGIVNKSPSHVVGDLAEETLPVETIPVVELGSKQNETQQRLSQDVEQEPPLQEVIEPQMTEEFIEPLGGGPEGDSLQKDLESTEKSKEEIIEGNSPNVEQPEDTNKNIQEQVGE